MHSNTRTDESESSEEASEQAARSRPPLGVVGEDRGSSSGSTLPSSGGVPTLSSSHASSSTSLATLGTSPAGSPKTYHPNRCYWGVCSDTLDVLYGDPTLHEQLASVYAEFSHQPLLNLVHPAQEREIKQFFEGEPGVPFSEGGGFLGKQTECIFSRMIRTKKLLGDKEVAHPASILIPDVPQSYVVDHHFYAVRISSHVVATSSRPSTETKSGTCVALMVFVHAAVDLQPLIDNAQPSAGSRWSNRCGPFQQLLHSSESAPGDPDTDDFRIFSVDNRIDLEAALSLAIHDSPKLITDSSHVYFTSHTVFQILGSSNGRLLFTFPPTSQYANSPYSATLSSKVDYDPYVFARAARDVIRRADTAANLTGASHCSQRFRVLRTLTSNRLAIISDIVCMYYNDITFVMYQNRACDGAVLTHAERSALDSAGRPEVFVLPFQALKTAPVAAGGPAETPSHTAEPNTFFSGMPAAPLDNPYPHPSSIMQPPSMATAVEPLFPGGNDPNMDPQALDFSGALNGASGLRNDPQGTDNYTLHFPSGATTMDTSPLYDPRRASRGMVYVADPQVQDVPSGEAVPRIEPLEPDLTHMSLPVKQESADSDSSYEDSVHLSPEHPETSLESNPPLPLDNGLSSRTPEQGEQRKRGRPRGSKAKPKPMGSTDVLKSSRAASDTYRPRARRKRDRSPTQRTCLSCGTTTSPEWRKGPAGEKCLCNACGLRYARAMEKYTKIEGPIAAEARVKHAYEVVADAIGTENTTAASRRKRFARAALSTSASAAAARAAQRVDDPAAAPPAAARGYSYVGHPSLQPSATTVVPAPTRMASHSPVFFAGSNIQSHMAPHAAPRGPLVSHAVTHGGHQSLVGTHSNPPSSVGPHTSHEGHPGALSSHGYPVIANISSAGAYANSAAGPAAGYSNPPSGHVATYANSPGGHAAPYPNPPGAHGVSRARGPPPNPGSAHTSPPTPQHALPQLALPQQAPQRVAQRAQQRRQQRGAPTRAQPREPMRVQSHEQQHAPQQHAPQQHSTPHTPLASPHPPPHGSPHTSMHHLPRAPLPSTAHMTHTTPTMHPAYTAPPGRALHTAYGGIPGSHMQYAGDGQGQHMNYGMVYNGQQANAYFQGAAGPAFEMYPQQVLQQQQALQQQILQQQALQQHQLDFSGAGGAYPHGTFHVPQNNEASYLIAPQTHNPHPITSSSYDMSIRHSSPQGHPPTPYSYSRSPSNHPQNYPPRDPHTL